MPRIFKGTVYSMKLYLRGDDITEINSIVFFTTNSDNSIEIVDNIRIVENQIEVEVNTDLFENMEDGVISYIVYGNDIIIQRQSSYYLKTPIPNTITGLQYKKTIVLYDNGNYNILPDEGFKALSEVEVEVAVDIDTPYLDGYNQGQKEGFEEGYNQGNQAGYDTGYIDGETAGYDSGVEIGKEEQKNLLESITITENGTYTKDDGYNEVIVEVPDINGSYDEGYENGYNEGLNNGVENLPILDITENGTYDTPNKGVNVNVLPKIDVAASKLAFSYSQMTEIPNSFDFSNVVDFSNMFRECVKLIITDDFTSQLNPTNLNYAFHNLQYMTKFPIINLENVVDFSYSFYNWKNASDTTECYNWYLPNCKNFTSSTRGWDKVSDWSFLSNWGITKDASIGDMISGDGAITVPAIENDGNSANGNCIFVNSFIDKQKLTYFGGYIGRKASIDNNYQFVHMPNLSYESCKSILENLYDFTGNGETPTSSQGNLKVHPNFLTTIGDEISIGTSKGWNISV